MIGNRRSRPWPIGPGLGLVAVLVAGCWPIDDRDEAVLRVATDWTDADRQELEPAFAAWNQRQNHGAAARPATIRWVEQNGDVRLGGPIADHPSGAVAVRTVRVGLNGGEPGDRPTTWDGLTAPEAAGRLAIGDPRDDPIPLELVTRWSATDGLAVALDRLGRIYGGAALVSTGSPTRLVDRGRADWALSMTAQPESRLEPSVEVVEGASIGPSVRNRELAEAFLAFLRDRQPQLSAPPSTPGRRELLADLLGSILVDGRVRPGRTEANLPPWPPASIVQLRQQPDGDSLVHLLAEQLVPDVEARTWLLQNWEEFGQVDARRLDALAEAADGRLVREPRFRAWLRGEWTAWARNDLARSIEESR